MIRLSPNMSEIVLNIRMKVDNIHNIPRIKVQDQEWIEYKKELGSES